MKAQEAFDKVCTHLAKQKTRSLVQVVTEGPVPHHKVKISCLYRAEDGKACAIGCLLSDDVAKLCDVQIETGIGEVWDIAKAELLLEDMSSERLQLGFYYLLQSAHDQATSLHSLKGSLASVADHFNLSDEKVSLITEWTPNPE